MKIRGGQLLARALHEKGVDQVFTLSGGFCNPALEGFMECGISVTNAPHEQVAGHLADGQTRITRKPAVCLVGPEVFATAVPAMMEAWGERSPVIFVTGSSTLKRQGSGGFKEIDDVSIAAPLTKYSVSITDGERISEIVDRAWKIALSGYPGAVHISMPVDIMFSSFDEDAMRGERPFDRSPQPPPRACPVRMISSKHWRRSGRRASRSSSAVMACGGRLPRLISKPVPASSIFPFSMSPTIKSCCPRRAMSTWDWPMCINTTHRNGLSRNQTLLSWSERVSTTK